MDVTLEVNGVKHRVSADPGTSLLEILRNDLDLTGTKYGCGESQCGACTVLLDGEPVHSCVTPLSDAAGKKVLTIEGVLVPGDPSSMHPLQTAFVVEGAMQCGYCVPGMIVAAYALLKQNPHPTRQQILDHMQGNVCRCGGYPRMLAAIERAAKEMK